MLLKRRYLLFSVLLLALLALHTRNGQWVGDFFEHAAVVRELATHPLHPRHPQLLIDAPHPFYSPYSLGVALVARTLHVNAVRALAGMGVVNLALLLVGLRLFIEALDVRYPQETAFYTLLLTLLWWGSDAWIFSGFFHIGALRYVLPYPSTFAAAVSLIAIWMNDRRLRNGKPLWLAPIAVIAFAVLLSHAITFVFLGVALFAQAWHEPKSTVKQAALVAAVVGAVFLLALFWPYFPVWEFFTKEASVFSDSNSDMYRQVISSIWPALAAVPFPAANLRTDWRRPLALMPMLLLAVYAAGGITGAFTLGRVIAYVVLLLHVTLADRFARWESNSSKPLVAAGVVAVGLALSWRPLGSTVKYSLLTRVPTYRPYEFLSQCTGQYDVVLSDVGTSWIVPTFGGKTVAADNTLAFVPDHEQRRADLITFFDEKTSVADRQAILGKYNVRYLLYVKAEGKNWLDWQRSFAAEGKVACENETFVVGALR